MVHVLMPSTILDPTKIKRKRSKRKWWKEKRVFQWVSIASYIKTMTTASTKWDGCGSLCIGSTQPIGGKSEKLEVKIMD